MAENTNNAEANSDTAKNMTREQLDYYTAVVKGKPSYVNAENVAVAVAVKPAGVTDAPTPQEAFAAISKAAAEDKNAAAMMRMGDLELRQLKDGDKVFHEPNQEAALDSLKNAHDALEATVKDANATAEQIANANWDMSAVHYYNNALQKGLTERIGKTDITPEVKTEITKILDASKEQIKRPNGINTSDEADLYYTTLAARTSTNPYHSEWVERVLEGTDDDITPERREQVMDMANKAPLQVNGEDAAPYVSTVGSRIRLLEAIRDEKTNPADPVDKAKFDEDRAVKLESLKKVDPNLPMSALRVSHKIAAPEAEEIAKQLNDGVAKNDSEALGKLGINADKAAYTGKDFSALVAKAAKDGFSEQELEQIRLMSQEREAGKSGHIQDSTKGENYKQGVASEAVKLGDLPPPSVSDVVPPSPQEAVVRQ